MIRYAIAALTLALFLAALNGGQFNTKISIGDAAPAFSKLPGTDGKEYSLDSFKDKEVLRDRRHLQRMSGRSGLQRSHLAFAKKYCGRQEQGRRSWLSTSTAGEKRRPGEDEGTRQEAGIQLPLRS